MRKGNETETGARTADRNDLAANWFSIGRSVWNLHGALLIEQRRTNQLLEVLIEQAGGNIPEAPVDPTTIGGQPYDPRTGMPISQVQQ